MDCDASPVNALKRTCYAAIQLLQSHLNALDSLPLEPQDPRLAKTRDSLKSALNDYKGVCAMEMKRARAHHERDIGAMAALESTNGDLAAQVTSCRAELQQAVLKYEMEVKGRASDAEKFKVTSKAAERYHALELKQSALECEAEKEGRELEVAALREALQTEKAGRARDAATARAVLQTEKEERAFEEAAMAKAALEAEGDARAAQMEVGDASSRSLLQFLEQRDYAAGAQHQKWAVETPTRGNSLHASESRGCSPCEGLSSLKHGQASPRQHSVDTDLCRLDDSTSAFILVSGSKCFLPRDCT